MAAWHRVSEDQLVVVGNLCKAMHVYVNRSMYVRINVLRVHVYMYQLVSNNPSFYIYKI